MKTIKTRLQQFLILLALMAGIHKAAAQGTTAFTYQGQLHDSSTNANGTYTMIFALYDSLSGGNQIGSTITTSPMLVNGLFTVNLDFGNAFNGAARWLDITVTNGGTTQELSPRVQVLPAPYAQFAAAAASITNIPWLVTTYPEPPAYGGTNLLFLDNGANILALNSNGAVVQGNLDVIGDDINFGSFSSVSSDSSGTIYISGALSVKGNCSAMAYNTTSDRNLKENFVPINPQTVLNRVAELPISQWNFKQDSKTRHIGPMAQDFYSAFNVGTDDKHIATVDEDGVALAAIQGLNQKLDEKDAELQKLKSQNETLEKRLDDLEQLVKTSAQK